jgi:hypothetical protein
MKDERLATTAHLDRLERAPLSVRILGGAAPWHGAGFWALD